MKNFIPSSTKFLSLSKTSSLHSCLARRIAIAAFGILLFLPHAGWSQQEHDYSLEGDMVYIPPGPFVFGTNKKDASADALSMGIPKPWYADETPQQKIFLKEFYIDRYEVTHKRYKKYIDALSAVPPPNWKDSNFPEGKENEPVTHVSWYDAANFCQWAKKQLPTEKLWERAARGTENRIYPWGNKLPDKTRANFGNCCFVQKGKVHNEVGHYQKGNTAEGISDLGGNVAEWVSDWYDKKYYKKSAYKNPKGPKKGKYHVIRGGAWNSLPIYLRSSSRYGDSDGKDYYGIGCRCAKDADLP